MPSFHWGKAMNFKKLFWGMVVAFGLLVTISAAIKGPGKFENSAPKSEIDAGIVPPGKVLSAMTAIRAEPKVIDATHDPKAVIQWTVGVNDDGTPRWGFAEYVCTVLESTGIPRAGQKVRIVDFRKFMSSKGYARGASLGSVDCATMEHTMP